MIRVQSPVIGNALRQALQLDAAGAMPMAADDVIVPVCIVGDVSRQLVTESIPVWQAAYAAAVAANYPYTVLRWQTAAPETNRIECTRLRLRSATQQTAYIGLADAIASSSSFQLPRRKIGSLQSSALTASTGSSNTATAPGTFLATVGLIVGLNANIDLEVRFDDPIILDLAGQNLVAIGNTVNTDLFASYDWREVRNG